MRFNPAKFGINRKSLRSNNRVEQLLQPADFCAQRSEQILHFCHLSQSALFALERQGFQQEKCSQCSPQSVRDCSCHKLFRPVCSSQCHTSPPGLPHPTNLPIFTGNSKSRWRELLSPTTTAGKSCSLIALHLARAVLLQPIPPFQSKQCALGMVGKC